MVVKITRKGNLDQALRRIQKSNLSKTFADQFSRELKKAVVENTQIRTGELEASIKTKKTRNGAYGIYGANYFWVVNDGRRPGNTIPPISGKLGMWAGGSSNWNEPGDARKLALTIAKYGTKPKHYYEKARMRIEAKKKRIAQQKIRRGL